MKHVLALLAVTGIAGAALAHTGATGIVKERMDGMGVLAVAMKKLAGAKNSGVVDANELTAIAQDIQAHSGQALLQRFPEGSLPHVSEASPVIWSDWEGFEAQANLLYEAAVALEKRRIQKILSLMRHSRRSERHVPGATKIIVSRNSAKPVSDDALRLLHKGLVPFHLA